MPLQNAFDPLNIPIQGTSLIEASAGTGKTYGITALFTRLVLLEKIPVERILVVTFTKAATAELKTRLRAQLNEAFHRLNNEHIPEENDFLQNLLAKALAHEPRHILSLRLKAAIAQFDTASVYTIHGFCQRLLRDYAFLCQAPFDMELNADEAERLLIPAQDFWREYIAHDPAAAHLVFKYKKTPASMLEQMRPFVGRPSLTYCKPKTDPTQSDNRLQTLWHEVASRLPALEKIFWQIFPALNQNSYKQHDFENLFAALNTDADQQCLSENNSLYKKCLPKLNSATLTGKAKKGKVLDSSYEQLNLLADLWDAVETKQEAEKDALNALDLDFLDYLTNAVAERKKTHRERNFDDLLLDVYTALAESAHRETLARLIADAWQIALIDEFQDTDPLQYGIFRKTFIRHAVPLFLVGDPKQAIYGFRGADIHAYLKAASDADHHFTLTKNYRSHQALIASINWFFQQKQNPFVLEGIKYADVSAARKEACLKPAGHALRIRWLNGNNSADLNKEALRKRAAEYCADEIAGLLEQAACGSLTYKDRRLQSSDIAVLVRTRNEGSLIGAALKKHGIQSALLQRKSVFSSPEAPAIAALLSFWIRPQETEKLRFALCSILFGYTAEALNELNNNETALLDYIDAAQTASATWSKHGIYAAMQGFAARYQLESELLARGNERSLTNYHQILELLAEEDEQSRSPESLHQWLLAQINNSTDNESNENKALRLESDESLIKIVTMHAAKGLQYPIVFCPFAWDVSSRPNQPEWQVIQRDTGTSELVATGKLSEPDKSRLADEELSERLRLLYVAMTRAEEQLTIYAAYFNNNQHNTFTYLLEGSDTATREQVEQTYAQEKQAENKLAMQLENWRRFLNNAPENTDIEWLEEPPEKPKGRIAAAGRTRYRSLNLPARQFEFIRQTSFSGLLRDLPSQHTLVREALQPAIDPAETGLQDITPPGLSENKTNIDQSNIHTFPKGTHAGLCLHALLEHFDFSRPALRQTAAVEATLLRYGFPPDPWLLPICSMLDQTAATRLFGQTSLSDLPPENRLPEMNFILKVEGFSPEKLKKWFAQPHIQLPPECLFAAQQLNFDTVKGFLNGFIDMTCLDDSGSACVIDYKSNYLGPNAASYNQQAMNEAMAEHHYYLQALIYAVAVGRYLLQRNAPIRTLHIRYLFLRGLESQEQPSGIWQWQLKPEDLAPFL